MEIKINSFDDLPLKKISNMQNDVIVTKSAFNKKHIYYYHEMLLDCSHK